MKEPSQKKGYNKGRDECLQRMIHCVEVLLGLAADNIGDEVRDKLKRYCKHIRENVGHAYAGIV